MSTHNDLDRLNAYPFPCGTPAAYTQGCRCPQCTQAKTAYKQEQRTGINQPTPSDLQLHRMFARYQFAPQPWITQAACRGMALEDSNLFFPHQGETNKTREAIAICNAGPCPVINECLDYALQRAECPGVWGGKSERERRRIRRKRAP